MKLINKEKKAQVAFEFISYVIVTISVILALTVVVLSYSTRAFDVQQTKALEELAYATQEEFLLASQVQQGYTRNFTLPTKTVGGEYVLENTNSTITFIGDQGSITLDIPQSNGTLTQGINTIDNNHGIININ